MLCVVTLLLLITTVRPEDGVFGKLKSGLQLAGKLLGIDRSKGVAELVSEAFGKTYKKSDGDHANGNIFSGFLRIFGFEVKKIGAMAVNAVIFVAQLISSSLTRPSVSQLAQAKQFDGTPLDWMMGSSQVIEIFADIKDRALPDNVINYIKERSLDEDTGCVQLLVCKGAPFIWGMQKALDSKINSTVKGTQSLYAYLPSFDEVVDHADACDKKYPFCFIHT